MAALAVRDYNALADAIKEEQAIIDEQASIIKKVWTRSAAGHATAKVPDNNDTQKGD